MRSGKYKVKVACSLLVIGLLWFKHTIDRQARLDESLIQAIQGDNTPVALNALRDGADPNVCDYDGNRVSPWQIMKERFKRIFFRRPWHTEKDRPLSALDIAVQHSDTRIVTTLLEQGAHGVNDEAGFSRTYGENVRLPLLLGAAQNGDAEIVKALLDHGAQVSASDAKGDTALMLCLNAAPGILPGEDKKANAATRRKRERYDAVATLLIQRGADIRRKRKDDGVTAISYAAEKDLTHVVDLLLAHGADPNTTSDEEEIAPVYWAARNNDVPMLRVLLDKGANVRPPNELTPPIVEASSVPVVRLLLDRGADPDDQGVTSRSGGTTALMQAAERNDMASVRLLLSRGAHVNIAADSGATALMKAADGGGREVIHALLNHGARLNVQDNYGRTALMAGAEAGNPATVSTLIHAGAELNHRYYYGKTALDEAVLAKYPPAHYAAVIALLKTHGAHAGR